VTRRKTPTGRLSTFRPRYQNIPIRSGEEPSRLPDEVKVSIRSAVHGDYAALEARILAAALTPLRPGGTE
jgi:DNA polymerase I-like protein with 3'-5' exonuclease and polymerase domains